ncbi:hypothetical protein K1719_023220 [Acacia pycnantha]|nr:hypothetical protein K1719_023220 [Acacia pycnantha]
MCSTIYEVHARETGSRGQNFGFWILVPSKGVLVSTLARQPLAVGHHEHGVALCYLLMLHSQRSIDYVAADDQQCHEDLPC